MNVLSNKRINFLFSAAVTLVMTVGAFAQVKLRNALDYDGDGKADIGVLRYTDSTWYKLGASFSAQQFGVSNTDIMAPGDYDGDGKGDIAVWRYSNGYFYILQSQTNTVRYVPFGTIGDEVVARDYDGDGKTDTAVIRRTGGNMVWYILQSSTGGFYGYTFGVATDFACPGDYDGDGKFDIAISRPGTTPGSQATFYIAKSSGGFTVAPWGLTGDSVVPGDYDGDGKTDLAVIRRSTTPTDPISWYILKSSDNSLYGRSFGTTEYDTSVQNDYDGDGKTDIAIWRETDDNFYILRSSDGVTQVVNFGLSNDTPIASYDTH